MTHEEMDSESKVWTVPADRMKAGKEHKVPLSPPALNLLKSLPQGIRSSFVFSAPRGGKLSDMTLTAVMRRLGESVTVHGFRSTFRDWAATETDYPREAAEFALAHGLRDKVEAAYYRSNLLEKRRLMMTDWASFCGATTPNIVPKRARHHASA
jgi:integrase